MIIKNKFDLIINPIVTEKSTILVEQNKYVFKISSRANKVSVKKSIEKIFGVEVKKVNILNQQGKVKKFKGITGRRSLLKKAFVTLVNGHTIDLAGGAK